MTFTLRCHQLWTDISPTFTLPLKDPSTASALHRVWTHVYCSSYSWRRRAIDLARFQVYVDYVGVSAAVATVVVGDEDLDFLDASVATVSSTTSSSSLTTVTKSPAFRSADLVSVSARS